MSLKQVTIVIASEELYTNNVPNMTQNAFEYVFRTARMAELGISGGRCKVYSGRKFPGSVDRLREISSDEENTFLLYPGKDSSPIEDIVAERAEEGQRIRDIKLITDVNFITEASKSLTEEAFWENITFFALDIQAGQDSFLAGCMYHFPRLISFLNRAKELVLKFHYVETELTFRHKNSRPH